MIELTPVAWPDLLRGSPVQFSHVDETGEKIEFTIVQPTPTEYDEGSRVFERTRRILMVTQYSDYQDDPCSIVTRRGFEDDLREVEEDIQNPSTSPDELESLRNRRARIQGFLKPGGYSLAEELSTPEASRTRDLWFLFRLLGDKDGNRLFDPTSKKDQETWDKIPSVFKEGCRAVLWVILRAHEDLPFPSGSFPKLKLSSVSGSE